jgi:hypothetical protein
MKKVSLFLASIMLALTAVGQQTEVKETVVEAPRLGLSAASNTQAITNKKAPIYAYLQSKLSDEKNIEKVTTDGVVVISFVVEPSGELSTYHVKHSVTNELDECVMACLKETSGQWLPGKVNGTPVAMESKIYVRFVIPGNPDHEQLSRSLTSKAVMKFGKGQNFDNAMALNKAQRQYKKSVNYLNAASKYTPDEYTIVFWQACAFEKLGNVSAKEQKMKELENLLAANPNHEKVEMAEIYARAK